MVDKRQKIDQKIITEATLRAERADRLDGEARGNIAEFFMILHEWSMKETAKPDADETPN